MATGGTDNSVRSRETIMRKFILATVAIVAFTGFAHAQETGGGGCLTDTECLAYETGGVKALRKAQARTKAINERGLNMETGEPNRKPRDTTVIKACGAAWREAKADEAVKAKGWPAYWSACAKAAKGAKAASALPSMTSGIAAHDD